MSKREMDYTQVRIESLQKQSDPKMFCIAKKVADHIYSPLSPRWEAALRGALLVLSMGDAIDSKKGKGVR